MNEREKIIRLWFDMWLKQQDLGIDKIFTEDVVYTESWCPKYENLKTVKHWFNEWNTRGKVIIWDIKQFFHKENQTVVEWYFKNEMNNADVNYAYSDDILFERELTEKVVGYGGALDLAFDWQLSANWQNHTEFRDLLAALWWKNAPYTEAVAYSDRQHTSDSGYTTWDPLVSGTEKNYSTYRQTLPVRIDTQFIYQENTWQYGAGLQYQFEDYVPRIGIGQETGNWQVFAWYRPIDQSIELTTRWHQTEVGFGMDNMRWDDAKFIHIRISYAY